MNVNAQGFTDRKAVALGYVAALAVVLITSVYPALTRLSVTTTLTPADILLLRLGVSGLLFAPYLVRHAREIPRSDWLSALPLSLLHGWGMAGCVVFGLQFAPASHAAALGPGAIAAWIALVGFLLYRIKVDSRRLAGISIIVVGVALILVASYRGQSLATAMIGDLMFLAASALGATYLVYIQRRGLDPVVAAALVCVASAMVVGPWHYFFAESAISGVPLKELAWQLVFQGVLFGCCALFALNYAVLAVGSQTVGVLSALVPVVGALCALLITRDSISGLEWTAIVSISTGVAVAFLPARGDRSVVAIRRVGGFAASALARRPCPATGNVRPMLGTEQTASARLAILTLPHAGLPPAPPSFGSRRYDAGAGRRQPVVNTVSREGMSMEAPLIEDTPRQGRTYE